MNRKGIAGNLPGFEEAVRALYACDQAVFKMAVANWPKDIQSIAAQMSDDAFTADVLSVGFFSISIGLVVYAFILLGTKAIVRMKARGEPGNTQ